MKSGETLKNKQPYRLPYQFSSMTTHHLYGITEPAVNETCKTYFAKYGFAFIADLLARGLDGQDIETAVNTGEVLAAHWPEKEPNTDFFWVESEEAKTVLSDLADQAVRFCYGQNEQQPIGGNFLTVGAEIGSQQLALAGVIYAREQGRLREIAELDNGSGPLYTVRGSFSAKMFDVLIPENP